MAAADMALTVPGSNTAEMAAVGLPMVVALPLNLAEKIPLPGAAQYVEKLPRGREAVEARSRAQAGRGHALCRPGPTAKPARMLVPEVRGILRPEDVALEAVQLLGDDEASAAMRRRLQEVMGPEGAAGRVAERLLQAATAGDDG